MQVAQVMGGYSLGGADLLRRAMGKKKPEEMAQQRAIFRDGAAAKGIPAATADETFDLMEKFAGYGFNKSHAAAYALLAYHTAWLKARHPAAFYAANMTVEMDDTDKLAVLLADARRFGIEFDPPDVNRGVHRFEPITGKDGKAGVRYGLGAIKGTGAGAIEAIVAARELEGPFRGLFDFCARIDRGRVNKRVVEALVKAGAFDRMQPDRASLLASIPLAFDWAESQLVNENQSGLFDFGDGDGSSHGSSTQEPALIPAEPWSVRQRLMLEKTAIGFYLSGHLFDHSQAEVRRIARKPVAELDESREPQLVAGIVAELRIVNGQRGRVAIFKLDDKTAAIEAVVADELIEAHRDRLKDDELLIVQGKVQPDRFSGGQRLNVTQIWDLAAARAHFGRHLGVTVSGALPDIGAIVARFPPRTDDAADAPIRRGLAVRVMLRRERCSADIELGETGWFWPSDDALDAWKAAVAADAPPPVVAYDG
jgi:DNA polymerase-3 subunit alpha